MDSPLTTVCILSTALRCCVFCQRTPQAIVAKDGSDNFTTITEAIVAAPENSRQQHFIFVKKGIYHEYILVGKKKTNILLIGEGMDNTIITGNKSFGEGTRLTSLQQLGFTAQEMTFRSDAGPRMNQSVALRAEANFLAFYRCRFDGYQDTLYTKQGKQFYRDCEVLGRVDFIFGNAAAVFQNCLIEARLPLPGQYITITAQNRETQTDETGIVLQNCTLRAKKIVSVPMYLGRLWGSYSRTVVMQSYMDHLISPKRWIEFSRKSLVRPFYLEYENRGPGAATDGRVKWAAVTSDSRIASNFTVRHLIIGDTWIPATVPHYLDL